MRWCARVPAAGSKVTEPHPPTCQCADCALEEFEQKEFEQWLEPGDLEVLENLDPSADDGDGAPRQVSASDDELMAAASEVLDQAQQLQARTVARLRELAGSAIDAAASEDPDARRHVLAQLSTELQRMAKELDI